MNIIKAVRTIDIAHTALNVPTNVVFPNPAKIVERSEYIPVCKVYKVTIYAVSLYISASLPGLGFTGKLHNDSGNM